MPRWAIFVITHPISLDQIRKVRFPAGLRPLLGFFQTLTTAVHERRSRISFSARALVISDKAID